MDLSMDFFFLQSRLVLCQIWLLICVQQRELDLGSIQYASVCMFPICIVFMLNNFTYKDVSIHYVSCEYVFVAVDFF